MNMKNISIYTHIILTKSPPHLERVVLIDSFVCVLTSWSCTTFFDFMYMCVRKYMCVDVVFYSLKMYDTDFDRIFWGCCIWFHVICCAWTRVMFQIMECVASSISRWLGCKAEYYLLSCSTHSISCLQLSRITNRSLAWRKFLQDPNWCDAFNMYVCHWVRYCPWEMFAGEFFWCALQQ